MFGLGFDHARHRRIIRRQCKLHSDVAVCRLDFLQQTEGHNIAAEAWILHRLQRLLNLLLSDRHRNDQSIRPGAIGIAQSIRPSAMVKKCARCRHSHFERRENQFGRGNGGIGAGVSSINYAALARGR